MRITLGGALGEALAKQAKKQSQGNKDSALTRYLGMFNSSWDYAHTHYHKRWEDNWKLYNNKRTKRSYHGIVNAFVPMVNSTVNTIVASLFNSNPAVNYVPNHPDQEQDTKVLNEMYEDFARRDGWVQKNKVNGRQGIITGNLCSFYVWKSDKNGGYVHKINMPVRDMIIDPNSHGPEDWSYVGRRFFASKKSLEKETIYDAEKQEYIKRYSNLDGVSESSGGSEHETDKQRKDQALGSTDPNNKDQVELLEIWTHQRVVVIANRSVIIENRENPHYTLAKSQFEQRRIEHEAKRAEYEEESAHWEANRRLQRQTIGEDIGEYQGEAVGEFNEEFDEESAGLLPFAHGRIYEDISLPYSSSDVDIIADQQELLNDLTNLNLEAVLYTIFPERTIDPKFATQIDNLDPMPGKTYPLPQGAMEWNTPPQIPANVFNERITIKDEIRESVAVSQITKGVSASDATTATEIKATLGRADTRIQEKAQTLANDFFAQEAKIVLRLVQLYAPESLWIRTTQDAKVSFKEINPSKFLGEYTPMVTLDVQKKLEQAETRELYMQAYQMLIADPTNNLAAIKEICLPKMLPDITPEQIERMITAPAQDVVSAVDSADAEPSINGVAEVLSQEIQPESTEGVING